MQTRLYRICGLVLSLFLPPAGFSAEAAPNRAFETGVYRNLFHELLGQTDAGLDARLAAAWQQLFYGNDDQQRVYYPAGTDLAYIADVGNGDVRSEGMSYGMMIAAQLDRKPEFDRIWKWARTHMYHSAGPQRGYFAWHCAFDGRQLSPNPASDGEEWFAMALLFASHRWHDGAGIFNYGAEAQALLREMLQKREASIPPIFDRQRRQVVFVPTPNGAKFTDPSYHLPAFYELWARWATDPADRAFWAEAARTSRDFFHRAAHPETGLMPEYANFDGTPFLGFGRERGDFRFDAWRTLSNVALDYAWFATDPWQVEQSNRVLRFLQSHAPAIPNQFSLAGKPLSTDSSSGLLAMAATAGLAAAPELARPFVQRLWDAPIPIGRWRYYDGLLHLIALLETGGRFRIHHPPVNRR